MTSELPLFPPPPPHPEFLADLKGNVQPASRYCQPAACDPFTLSLPVLPELLWQAVDSSRRQHFCVRPEVVTGQKTEARVRGGRVTNRQQPTRSHGPG